MNSTFETILCVLSWLIFHKSIVQLHLPSNLAKVMRKEFSSFSQQVAFCLYGYSIGGLIS